MKKILIIDDDSQNRFLLKLVLEKENYKVIEAKTGKEGIEAVEKKPDLILLDIMMPDISGFEVYRRIKDKNIPVVFLTALGKGDFQEDVDYILKPIDIKELIKKIKSKIG